jgi:hypothetical protein
VANHGPVDGPALARQLDWSGARGLLAGFRPNESRDSAGQRWACVVCLRRAPARPANWRLDEILSRRVKSSRIEFGQPRRRRLLARPIEPVFVVSLSGRRAALCSGGGSIEGRPYPSANLEGPRG